MTIQQGLIWDYYDCAHACYLFGKIELPCTFMYLSTLLFVIFLIFILLLLGRRFIK